MTTGANIENSNNKTKKDEMGLRHETDVSKISRPTLCFVIFLASEFHA